MTPARTAALFGAVLTATLFLSSCGNQGSDAGSGSGPIPVVGGVEYARSVSVGGRNHTYFMYVPAGRVGDDSVPLVLSLHGGGSNAVEQEAFTRLRLKAIDANFAVLSPNGFLTAWNAGSCCAPATTAPVDHVAVIRAMLDDASALINVDNSRVFALGHSNGGMMTYRLACELSDRIAAIASNAAVMMDRDLDTTPPTQAFTCQPARPVPILATFGLADQCTPYGGGQSAGVAGGLRPPASDTIDFWVNHNRCLLPPLLPSYTNGAARCMTWSGCQAGANVQLCTVEGAGHVWPGTGANPAADVCGGSGTTDLNANDRIWDFFRTHPMN